MNFSVVFPGQGSQSVGMLASLAQDYPQVKQTFEQASEVLTYDLWELVNTDSEGKLNKTEYTQPAMLAAGVVIWRIWSEYADCTPKFLAGHSLGEYSALVASQAITFEDAIRVVSLRGQLMQEAVPEGEGAMAAILGLDDDVVKTVCQEASGNDLVEAANFNSPGQVVVAGHIDAVNRAVEIAKSSGAKRALLLPVSVPSHSKLMQHAADRLYEVLQGIEIKMPEIPVIHNFNARSCETADEIADVLKLQLYNPVFWVDTIKAIVSGGVNTIFEFGPGKVLTGLCKRIDRNLNCVAVEDADNLLKAKELLKG